jgi:hypothetical protein
MELYLLFGVSAAFIFLFVVASLALHYLTRKRKTTLTTIGSHHVKPDMLVLMNGKQFRVTEVDHHPGGTTMTIEKTEI